MIKKLYHFLNPKFQTLHLEYPVDFKPRYGHGKPPHKELYDIISAHGEDYKKWLLNALNYQDFLWKIKKSDEDQSNSSPVWNNGFLPGLDMVMLYTILAELKPKRYIEVGSGNSTKVAHKAKTEQQLQMKITSIDPAPRAEIDNLSDEIIRKPFEDLALSIVDELEENDILFIDNSHRILPNSDAMVFFMEVLPKLKKGVVVQIHDIYLPYDYPQFMCDRFYSEQYGLAMYLLANHEKYKPLVPNYFISEDKALSKIIAPFWEHQSVAGVEQHGGSFWLQIS